MSPDGQGKCDGAVESNGEASFREAFQGSLSVTDLRVREFGDFDAVRVAARSSHRFASASARVEKYIFPAFPDGFKYAGT